MEYKQAIFKAKEVDLTATVSQLDTHEAVYLPFMPNLRIGAIRTAISRLNKQVKEHYTVKETVNGSVITREI